jgi:GntP family gluconate:H+ symporter
LDYDDKIQHQYSGKSGRNKEEKRNNFLLSILPILVPLILIGISSFIPATTEDRWWKILTFVGEPFIALAIGVLLALFQFGKKFQMRRVTKLTEKSIEKAALVILITAAGGAFGHIIQKSGIVDKISGFTRYAGNLGFLFPFLLAALFTTTTGSLTVSMITTASVVMPLLPALNMSPQLAAALIGSGSFCVFHVNSSFFWLLNRLHDVPSGILLKTFTVQSLCMGIGGLFSVILMRIFGVL